jgi:3-oxoadipate CoA-transferase beta subunit
VKRLRLGLVREGRPPTSRNALSCSYPLTAPGAVKRIYTNLAVIDVTPDGFEVADMVAGLSFEDLQARTGARLRRPAA